jgi:hypothetical protein
MKKTLMVAACAAMLVGCATSGRVFDTARTVAGTAPAVVEDAQSLWGGIEDLYARVTALFKAPTNAPVVVTAK